jgi:hypothetical protein
MRFELVWVNIALVVVGETAHRGALCAAGIILRAID